MFAPLCYPPAGSEAIVTAKLVLAMTEAGWEIDVITQGDFGHYYPTENDSVWEPVKRRLISIDGINRGKQFDRFASMRGFRFLQRLRPVIWATKSFFRACKLLRTKRYDAIFSRVAPQYGHLPALLLSLVSKTPWYAAWSDPMPAQKAPAPYGQGLTAKIPLPLQAYLNAIVQRANWHVFPCERLHNYYLQYLKQLAGKSSTIPHIASNAFTRSQPIVPKSASFTLCYTGGLTLRDPTVFLKGVRLFLNKFPVEDHFVVNFVGMPVDGIESKAIEENVADVVYLHSEKTYLESLEIAAQSTVLLVIEACCAEGIFFPSKFVDFVQTGRPILAVSPSIGTLADILIQYGGGVAVDCTSPEDVARGITKLYTAWKSGELEQLYSSKHLLPLFCDDTVLNAYHEIISKGVNCD
jgi:hypothetical protein